MSDPFDVHLLDQIEAANAEADRVFDAMAKITGQKPELAPSGIMGEWNILPLMPGCAHIASPVPLFGLLAEPRVLRCIDCHIEAAVAHSEANPDTCDLCGRRSEYFYELNAQLRYVGDEVLRGVVVVSGHVCEDCK